MARGTEADYKPGVQRGDTANTAATAAQTGYICPVTGEVLSSPECCPYKNMK